MHTNSPLKWQKTRNLTAKRCTTSV